MTAPASQQGFTLLEALVALVVISIGLLGLLGLQTVAIVDTHVSKSQTLASIATDDIADRIRANPDAAASLVYANISDTNTSKPNTDCSQTACGPQAMANYDAWEWQQTLAATLPNGRGDVSCISPASPTGSSPCTVYHVSVLWHGQNKAAGSGTADAGSCAGSNNGSSTSLRCHYAIEVRP